MWVEKCGPMTEKTCPTGEPANTAISSRRSSSHCFKSLFSTDCRTESKADSFDNLSCTTFIYYRPLFR